MIQLVEKSLIKSQFQGKSHQVGNVQLVAIGSDQVAWIKNVQAVKIGNFRVVETGSDQAVHILRLRLHHPRHQAVPQLIHLKNDQNLRQKRKV